MRNHVAPKWLKVTNAASRKQTLRKKRLCFICFKLDDLASSFNPKYKRPKCNGKLHIRICTFDKSDEYSDQNNDQPNCVTATNFSNNRNNILVQTASGVVSNINNSEKLTTNLMLDNGSQRSYISFELRHKLHFPKIRTEGLLTKTLGNTNSKRLNVVHLNIMALNKIITIEAICTSVICESLSNKNVRKVSSNYNHLRGLKLADCSGTEIEKLS